MKRIWHPYWNWEEWKAGMWRRVSKEDEAVLLPLAIEFTGNTDLYGSFMIKATNEWPISCEHNLTDASLNKQAWIGHAASSLAHGLPEYIVRRAWGLLSDEQRGAANIKAQFAVDAWTREYKRGRYGWQTSFEF